MRPSGPRPGEPAPELEVSAWLNTPVPLSLAALRGRVVLLHAFQMLCPGCVGHGLPQAAKVHRQLGDRVAVIGLHTVFEHHAMTGEAALRAFVGEYRLRFPIAVDRPSPTGPVPQTMARYGLQGTPSLVLIDRRGVVRMHRFGPVDDLALGVVLGGLLNDDEAPGGVVPGGSAETAAPIAACTPEGCTATR